MTAYEHQWEILAGEHPGNADGPYRAACAYAERWGSPAPLGGSREPGAGSREPGAAVVLRANGART